MYSYLHLQTFKPQKLPCVLGEEREAEIFIWVPCWGRKGEGKNIDQHFLESVVRTLKPWQLTFILHS